MGIQVDIFGSRVCRDMMRYAAGKNYEVACCIGSVPITSLYEPIIKFREEEVEQIPIDAYEKKMLKVQFTRSAVRLLKKSSAQILLIDLAEEALNRCQISEKSLAGIAVQEENENIMCRVLGAKKENGENDLICPETFELEWAEKKYEQFAKEIIKTEKNPDGYLEKNIVVIESYFTEKIIGNQDGILLAHDKKYRVHQINEWLKKLYGILYKNIPNCHVIRFPIFTYTTENHLRGIHPLSYTMDTYQYFVNAFDILCGKSKINSVNNLYAEQCLRNKLNTRVIKSTVIYSIDTMKKEIKNLQQQVSELQKQLAEVVDAVDKENG